MDLFLRLKQMEDKKIDTLNVDIEELYQKTNKFIESVDLDRRKMYDSINNQI